MSVVNSISILLPLNPHDALLLVRLELAWQGGRYINDVQPLLSYFFWLKYDYADTRTNYS